MRTLYRLSSRSFVGSIIFGVIGILFGILILAYAIFGHITDQTTMLEDVIGGVALVALGGFSFYNAMKMKAKKK